jgi:hypothetical protein
MTFEGLNLGPIAQQTKLVAFGYGMLVLALVGLTLLALRKTSASLMIMTILLTIISAFIGTYAVNCMVYGSCHALAWAISVAMTIVGAFYLLLVLFYAIAMRNGRK